MSKTKQRRVSRAANKQCKHTTTTAAVVDVPGLTSPWQIPHLLPVEAEEGTEEYYQQIDNRAVKAIVDMFTQAGSMRITIHDSTLEQMYGGSRMSRTDRMRAMRKEHLGRDDLSSITSVENET